MPRTSLGRSSVTVCLPAWSRESGLAKPLSSMKKWDVCHFAVCLWTLSLSVCLPEHSAAFTHNLKKKKIEMSKELNEISLEIRTFYPAVFQAVDKMKRQNFFEMYFYTSLYVQDTQTPRIAGLTRENTAEPKALSTVSTYSLSTLRLLFDDYQNWLQQLNKI